jgi:NADH-quinone oxidoreductase subunit J
MISALFFYLFALITVASGFAVITARNPVHAVLFLILAFFNASGLFILMGAEFLAMLLVVVYVGAVAVLFLFVVMMLDIDYTHMREGFQRHLPIGGVVGFVLLVELMLIFSGPETTFEVAAVDQSRSNTAQLGDVLYTDYLYLFQLAGLILLVAMIGAITLTMRKREGVKRQSIAEQNARRRDETITVVALESHVAPTALPDARNNHRGKNQKGLN